MGAAGRARSRSGSASGSCPHNFNPARIFMGDAGAMFLGLLLATTTITVGGRTADPFSGQTYFYFAPLLIPLGDPRRADRRHRVLVPASGVAAPVVRAGGPRAPAPPPHAHGSRPAAGGGDPLAVDRAAVGRGLLLPTFTNRGNSLVPLAVVALGLLLYIYFHPGVRSCGRQEQADQRPRRPSRPAPRAAWSSSTSAGATPAGEAEKILLRVDGGAPSLHDSRGSSATLRKDSQARTQRRGGGMEGESRGGRSQAADCDRRAASGLRRRLLAGRRIRRSPR